MSPLSLGPFQLEAPVGRGGMGQVWRGIHQVERVPVAVKVMTRAPSRHPDFLSAFRNEVRAVASLNHPNIVMVFDYGEVPSDVAERSEGRLIAGSPYLVMEWLSGGALDRRPLPSGWVPLRKILLNVLDGLAFAHARGILHRDLKLRNIVLGTSADVRPGLKLIDFGLAAVGGTRTHQNGLVAITPTYAAPECILPERRRDQGPWTDLYSVGGLAFALASGRPPFQGGRQAVLEAHLKSPLPKLANRLPVPPRFQEWLERMMAKDPAVRFRRAADAATALRSLGSVEPHGHKGLDTTDPLARLPALGAILTLRTSPRAPILDIHATPSPSKSTHTQVESADPKRSFHLAKRRAATRQARPSAPFPRPRQPDSWRRNRPRARSMKLIGAGLGLFELRSVPTVGRDRERDVLWSELRRTSESGSARVLLLHGPAGIGKSELAQWLCHRAHELGTATILSVVHSPIPGPSDELGRMVGHTLDCTGLDRAEVQKRLERLLRAEGIEDAYEWQALTELIRPGGDDEADETRVAGVQFSSTYERYAVVRRLLQRLARKRPVVMWLDDVEWGADSLGFVEHLLDAQADHPIPVLVVLTARDETLVERPDEARRLAAIGASPVARRLAIGPLDGQAQSVLIHELLGLEPGLASQVGRRTQGNPLFAVQLVGDWVHRGLLTVGDTGFVLDTTVDTALPDDIHEVWAARVDRLLDDLAKRAPLGARKSSECTLELAAVLGHQVDLEEWRIACAEANLPAPDSLLEPLLATRLARPVQGGIAFVHGMLRESLERRTREQGRWAEHNRHCAAMLSRQYPSGTPGVASRLARHLTEAGDLEATLEPLLTAAREQVDRRHRFRDIHAYLDRREEALDTLGVGAQDRRRVEGWITRATAFSIEAQRFDDAVHWAEAAVEVARPMGWTRIVAEGVFRLGYVAHHRGQITQAAEYLRQAQKLYASVGDLAGVSSCLVGLGHTSERLGDLTSAEEFLQTALSLARRASDTSAEAKALRALAVVTRFKGDLDRSLELSRRAMELLRDQGNRLGEAACLNDLAECERERGNLDEADRLYEMAVDRYQAIGTGQVLIARFNRAIVWLARSEHARVRNELEDVGRLCRESGFEGLLAGVHALLLTCVAALGEWQHWDEHIRQATVLLEKTDLIDRDFGWALERAADLARAADYAERAQGAYELALRQWQGLSDEERCEAIGRKMDADVSGRR